jgi:hypothetical protein
MGHFMADSGEIRFEAEDRRQLYSWVEQVLIGQGYALLATISVAHLYNLRKHARYRERLLHYTKTRPATVSIGERRKPQPLGQPGFLRLDTVHPGDQPEGGEKGSRSHRRFRCGAADAAGQKQALSSAAPQRVRQRTAKRAEEMTVRGKDCES